MMLSNHQLFVSGTLLGVAIALLVFVVHETPEYVPPRIPCSDSVCRPGVKSAHCECGASHTLSILANGDVMCTCKTPFYPQE
jgi:hypothetical protein